MGIAVVGRRADCARTVGAVVVVVQRIAGAGDGVNAEHIVHIAVAVVVHAIAWDFARIAPHLWGEFEMVVIDAGVNHRDDDVG